MNKWDAVVRIFQQYFAHMMMMPGDNKILYVKEPRFRLKIFPPPAGLEPETVRSVGEHLTEK